MKKQTLWQKWKNKLENDPEVMEAEGLGKTQISGNLLEGDLKGFAEIAAIFGVIKLGQSLSK